MYTKEQIQGIRDHIRNGDVAGNAYSDMGIWRFCDEVVMDRTLPIDVRLEASRKVDEIMGEEVEEWKTMTDEDRVEAHRQILVENY